MPTSAWAWSDPCPRRRGHGTQNVRLRSGQDTNQERSPMQIVCTSCQAKIKVPDSAAGKKGKCPKCGTVLTLPLSAPTEGGAEGMKAADTGMMAAAPPPVVELPQAAPGYSS